MWEAGEKEKGRQQVWERKEVMRIGEDLETQQLYNSAYSASFIFFFRADLLATRSDRAS